MSSDCCVLFFFFKQKTAYEMRISDWSSDVCSSDLAAAGVVDRDYDAPAKKIVDVAGIGVALHEPELLGILRIDAVERAHQRRWFTDLRSGGEADAEAVDHRVTDPAAGEKVTRIAGGAVVGGEQLRTAGGGGPGGGAR